MLVLTHLLGRPSARNVDGSPTSAASAVRLRAQAPFLDPLLPRGDAVHPVRHRGRVLIPWAVTFREFAADKLFVLGEMAVFLGILIVGFVYLWKRGALEWE